MSKLRKLHAILPENLKVNHIYYDNTDRRARLRFIKRYKNALYFKEINTDIYATTCFEECRGLVPFSDTQLFYHTKKH
jgi:hypothetical protein